MRPPRLLLVSLLSLPLLGPLACSTGDPDPEPADQGRIQRTITHADSALNPAREHIRTIDTIGEAAE